MLRQLESMGFLPELATHCCCCHKPTTTRTHLCQPTLLLSTKTNMANTTFNDENTLCPSVPRRKGKAELLSTKTNMANTTFNDENTLCHPCNNAEQMNHVTMVITRTRVAIEIAREIYYKAVFRWGGQPQSAYDHSLNPCFPWIPCFPWNPCFPCRSCQMAQAQVQAQATRATQVRARRATRALVQARGILTCQTCRYRKTCFPWIPSIPCQTFPTVQVQARAIRAWAIRAWAIQAQATQAWAIRARAIPIPTQALARVRGIQTCQTCRCRSPTCSPLIPCRTYRRVPARARARATWAHPIRPSKTNRKKAHDEYDS
jgi:hypothetical protein